jgi:hypothetical protein
MAYYWNPSRVKVDPPREDTPDPGADREWFLYDFEDGRAGWCWVTGSDSARLPGDRHVWVAQELERLDKGGARTTELIDRMRSAGGLQIRVA